MSEARSPPEVECNSEVCPGSSGSTTCPFFAAILKCSHWRTLQITPEIEPSWLHNNTPYFLKLGIRDNNLEGVCSLLYYDVNLRPTNKLGPGALEFAIQRNYFEIAKIILNYYDDLYFETQPKGCNNFLTKTLLICNNIAMFKLLFRRTDPSDANQMNYLLRSFIVGETAKWDTTDWLEGLYLILANLNTPTIDVYCEPYNRFYSCLFHMFRKKNVEKEDRMKITYICLSFGIPVSARDYNIVYKNYGFEDEFEALIYGSNASVDFTVTIYRHSFPFIPVVANPFKGNFVSLIDGWTKFGSSSQALDECFYDFLGLYSLSVSRKTYIKEKCNLSESYERVVETLNRVPEFPTLFQLCRDVVREMVHEKITYPYQFHDVVKGLKVPESIRDGIRFKIILYR